MNEIKTREGRETRHWRVADGNCAPELGALIVLLQSMQAEGMPDNTRVNVTGDTMLHVAATWSHVDTHPVLA